MSEVSPKARFFHSDEQAPPMMSAQNVFELKRSMTKSLVDGLLNMVLNGVHPNQLGLICATTFVSIFRLILDGLTLNYIEIKGRNDVPMQTAYWVQKDSDTWLDTESDSG